MQTINPKDCLPYMVVIDHLNSPVKCIIDTTATINGRMRPQVPSSREYPIVSDRRYSKGDMALVDAFAMAQARKAEEAAKKDTPKGKK
ncbi:MAG: hypothetical protein H7836_13265 [Magnetococcus sp. YQC-3]